MEKRQLNKIIKGAIKVKELAQASSDPGLKKQASTLYDLTKRLVKSQGKTNTQ